MNKKISSTVLITILILIMGLPFIAIFGFVDRKSEKVFNCDNSYQIKEKLTKNYFLIPIITDFVSKKELFLVKNGRESPVYAGSSRIFEPGSETLTKIFNQNLNQSNKIVSIFPNQNNQNYDILILPSKMYNPSEVEFDILTKCLQNHSQELYSLPQKLAFGSGLSETEMNKKLHFICPQEDKIKIYYSGSVNYTGDSYIQLGEINKNDKFIMRSGKVDTTSVNSIDLKVSYTDNKIPRWQNYKKEAVDKFYDQNGVKNDYLQTCKNSEGKTIFEIFKNENN